MKDTITKTPMKSETKNIRHDFTGEEKQQLGGDLARSFGALRGIESEFDGIKASYKSKTAEAEARIDRLSTDITNGFVMRDTPCFVVYRPADKEKDYYLDESDAGWVSKGVFTIMDRLIKSVLTERMTTDDFQQELIEAESKFDAREEIELFKPVDGDRGILVVGRLASKWFSALRVKIGKLELNERLDAEQPCCKARPDAVAKAVKRVNEWAKVNLKDLALGFQASFNAVAEAHKERSE
jgi:hypothetical protein